MTTTQRLGLLFGFLLPLIILLYPADLPLQPRLALGISIFAILFWTFEPIPIEYTSILMLFLLTLLQIVPFEAAFSAFSGKAVWLIFAGMALSLGITETPLGERLSQIVISRAKTYRRLILSLHLVGVLMALLIPSGVVRILILMPILISLLKSLHEKPGSRVSAALILSLVCATYYSGTAVLTASVPNMIILGVLESRGVSIYWGQWLFYLFPVIGFLRVVVCYLLIRILIPIDGTPSLAPQENHKGQPMAPSEKKVLGILLLGILLWATDTFHGIHPVYIGFTLVLLCYLPGWGPLTPILLKQVNFPLLIFITAAFAIGTALEQTGFSQMMAESLTGWFDLSGTSTFFKLGVITYLVAPFDFLMDTAAVGSVLTPILLDFGARLSLTPLQIAFSTGIGTGLVFIPYQAAPFVVAYGFRYVRMGQFIQIMTLISLTTLILLLPLNLLYWRLVGFIE